MFNNYNLCHIRTVNWDEIITGHNAKYTYVYNLTSPERECPVCHANCTAGCWGEVRVGTQREITLPHTIWETCVSFPVYFMR